MKINVRAKTLGRKKESFMKLYMKTIPWHDTKSTKQQKKKKTDKLFFLRLKNFVQQRTLSTE